MLLANALILGDAAFFGVMGLIALARPDVIPAIFAERLTTADGRSEVRAVYGGYGIAVAAMLVYVVAVRPPFAVGILWAMAISVGGMAGGRLLGALFARSISLYPTAFFIVVEIVLTSALVGAIYA